MPPCPTFCQNATAMSLDLDARQGTTKDLKPAAWSPAKKTLLPLPYGELQRAFWALYPSASLGPASNSITTSLLHEFPNRYRLKRYLRSTTTDTRPERSLEDLDLKAQRGSEGGCQGEQAN